MCVAYLPQAGLVTMPDSDRFVWPIRNSSPPHPDFLADLRGGQTAARDILMLGIHEQVSTDRSLTLLP
jgi:hypothetical protein